MTRPESPKGADALALPSDRAVAADAAEPVVSALRASIPSALAGCAAFRVPDTVRIERAKRGFVLFATSAREGEYGDQFAFTTAGELATFLFAMWDDPAQAIEARQRQDAETGLARKGESAVPEGNAP